MKERRPKTIRPVRANVGLGAAYRKRLEAAVEEMHRSILHWLRAAYRASEPEIARLAADASPARSLDAVLTDLARRWLGRFDELAPSLAEWFSAKAMDRSDATLRAALRAGGISVKFRMTRAMNDAYRAKIAENVGLIRSIAEEHLSAVKGHVMRSVQLGRDLGSLTRDLERQFGVTKRRAALISFDQNQKATAIMTRARQLELGITKAKWRHSAAGKEPRPSHVKASRDGVVYSIAEGWYDPDEGRHIQPGELIRCRCTAAPLIEGFA